jgi:fumarylacetoacetate (FAA) hydrolase
MKLATLRNGTRDGELVLVSTDLSKGVRAADVVAGLLTMQQLLDGWDSYVLPTERVAAELDSVGEGTRLPVFDFDAARAMAPLPRAYQWADGSAYLNHVELARKARGATMPESFATDPLMYQGGSDTMLGPNDPIELVDEAWGLDPWRCANGRFTRGRARLRSARRARQRRVVAQSDPRRDCQGLRLLPRQAVLGLLSGRRYA